MPKLKLIQDINQMPKIVQESIDKILQDYDLVESQLNNYNSKLPIEYQSALSLIISNVISMKSNHLCLYEILSTIFCQPLNESSTSNSDNCSYTITPRLKHSYDLISNELGKLEKINKQIVLNQAQISSKKKRRILILEQSLQDYLDDVKKFDYTKLVSNYDECFSGKNNIENVSNMLKQNNDLLKHKQIADASFIKSELLSFCDDLTIEYNHGKNSFHDYDNNEDTVEIIQTEISNKDQLYNCISKSNSQKNNNDSIINHITKMNVNKNEEMIEIIQNLLSKNSFESTSQ